MACHQKAIERRDEQVNRPEGPIHKSDAEPAANTSLLECTYQMSGEILRRE
jgi:hypothetical protein